MTGRELGFGGGGGDSKKAKGREDVEVWSDLDEELEAVEQFEDTELERTRGERGVVEAKDEAAGGGGRGRAV